MNEEDTIENGEEMLPKGRRIFKQLAFGSVLLQILVLIEEVVTWNAPVFLIGLGLIFSLTVFFWVLVSKGHAVRWLLFCTLLMAGAFTFLLGGLHLTDLREQPLDPLCYWLVGAGLGLIGIGGYSAYSIELDYYFKWLMMQKQAQN